MTTKNQNFINALEKSLVNSDTSQLGYVGLIGSLRNDVDIVMFPSIGANIGEALIASRDILKEADNFLQQGYVSACSLFCMQPETYFLAAQTKGKNGQVKIHDLFFPDKNSLVNNSPAKFANNVLNTQQTLFGNYDIIEQLPTHNQEELEPFFVLQNSQLLHSHLPEKVLIDKTRKTISYINKNYNTSTNIPKSLHHSDCERLVRDTFCELDSKNT